jgi:hypothetical protein
MADCRRRIIDFVENQGLGANGLPATGAIGIGSRVVEFDKAEWESYRDAGPELDEGLWLNFIERKAARYAKMLMAKRWSMVFIDQPLFVTSDHPLFVVDPELSRHQLAGKNAILIFPVSPTRILHFDDVDAPANLYYHLENDQADLYNLFTWVNTEGFMISSRPVPEVLAGVERIRRQFDDHMLKANP